VSTIRIAWRNLWRNGRRTAITFAAVSLNTAILIVSFALMIGIVDDLIHNVTDLSLGQVQVHHPKYRSERSIYDTVKNPEKILAAAQEMGISAATRSYGFGLLSHGTKSAGVQFCGVSPTAEKNISDLYQYILDGSYLPDLPDRKVVVGRKLARTLETKIGDELVVVVQAADGSLGNELFYVAGVLKSVGETTDRTLALIDSKDFEELFATKGLVHEIALNSRGRLTEDQVAAAVKTAAGDSAVETWRQLLPPLNDMLNSMNGVLFLFGLVFFLAAGLGVMNTMLMATYERIREFGLLKAIGASPWRVLREVTAEALVLALASTLVGGAVGVFFGWYFEHFPIDLTVFSADGFSTMGVAMSPLWRATLSPETIWIPIVMMWIISLLAALWPAVKAARLDPVKALSHV